MIYSFLGKDNCFVLPLPAGALGVVVSTMDAISVRQLIHCSGFWTLQFLIYRYCYHLFNRQYFLLMDTLLIRACGFFSFFS